MGAAGDFDGDGRLDLAIIDEAETGGFRDLQSRETAVWRAGAASRPAAASVLRWRLPI